MKHPDYKALREQREYQTGTISRLEARIEAERRIRAEGWSLAYIIDYR